MFILIYDIQGVCRLGQIKNELHVYLFLPLSIYNLKTITVIILSIRTDRSGQTV